MSYIDTMKNLIIFETIQDIEPVNRDSSVLRHPVANTGVDQVDWSTFSMPT